MSHGRPEGRVEARHHAAEADLAAIRQAPAGTGGTLVTAGGDGGVELALMERARRAHGDRLAVVRFDAHGGLNTPAASPGGGLYGEKGDHVRFAFTAERPPGRRGVTG